MSQGPSMSVAGMANSTVSQFKMKFIKKTFYWLLLTFRLWLKPSSERSV